MTARAELNTQARALAEARHAALPKHIHFHNEGSFSVMMMTMITASWNRALLQKLRVPQLVKKFFVSHDTGTFRGPYLEPRESNPYYETLLA
jgi:hypothetical protein